MAVTTHRISTAFTTNVSTYTSGSFTPAENELVVVFVTASGTVASGIMTDSVGLGFTMVRSNIKLAGVDTVYCFVSNNFATGAAMTVTFDCTGDAATGCVIQALSLTGMQKRGSAAVRQIASAVDQAAGTPAPVFSSAVLTGNPTLGVLGNATNPATMTPPTSWTEANDTGYITPTTGAETIYRDSGFTGTTVTWGSSSASNYTAIVLELDTSAATYPLRQTKKVSKTSTAGTTGTVAMLTTTTGSLVVVSANNDQATTGGITGVSCLGMTFTKLDELEDAGGANESFWYAWNITGQTTPTLTVTFAAGLLGGAIVREYGGVRTTADPLDKHTFAFNAVADGAPSSGATAALTGSNDLVIGWAGTLDSGNVYTAGAGFGGASSLKIGTTLDLGIEEKELTASNAAQTATFSIPFASFWGAGVAAFRKLGDTDAVNTTNFFKFF